MRIHFPYPEVTPLDVPDPNLLGIFATPEHEPDTGLEDLLVEALRAPIGTAPLRELADGKRHVLIVCDDITRPTPVHRLLPPLLVELQAAGVPDGAIEFLIALGTHRPMTGDEIVRKFGAEVAARYPIHNHEWNTEGACEYVGDTAQGVPVWINKRVAAADLVIGIGRIMPIEVCGFTGGGKILIPGVCGAVTNDEMHWTRIDLPNDEVVGRADNPVRASIDALARKAGLDFIVNVVMDIRQRVSHVVAGDLVEAHRVGCAHAKALHCVQIPRHADIVVADSYPFDIEFWQANKALDTTGLVVREGGVVILVTPCREGLSRTHGEILDFGYRTIDEIKELVRTRQIRHKVVGVHMAQVSHLARHRATVILVTDGIPPDDVRRVGLNWAATPQEALAQAFAIAGSRARVAVLRGAAEMLPVVNALETQPSQ
ncbi:MAG: nickel-dependent lactate racemase [Vicinamibacteraceae bacterium]|nr:nickel-dependent lactate racemase [Vicinamibacteraceae bacterium]